MWKRELLRNKVYALSFIVLGVLSIPIDDDATFFIFALIIGVPIFLSKKNWVVQKNYRDKKQMFMRVSNFANAYKKNYVRNKINTTKLRQK